MLYKKNGQVSYLQRIRIFPQFFLYKASWIFASVLTSLAPTPAAGQCLSEYGIASTSYERLVTAVMVQGLPGYTTPYPMGAPYPWAPMPDSNGLIGNRVALPAIGFSKPLVVPRQSTPYFKLTPMPASQWQGSPVMQRPR